MAVFCGQTGARIKAPTGDERADAAKTLAATKRAPVCKAVDPVNGWDTEDPPAAKPRVEDAVRILAAEVASTPKTSPAKASKPRAGAEPEDK